MELAADRKRQQFIRLVLKDVGTFREHPTRKTSTVVILCVACPNKFMLEVTMVTHRL
jgi:hypothetical protein